MENNGYKGEEDVKMEKCKETVVYMCGYLPGISPDKSPILSPIRVRLHGDDAWKDVCGGGCGFAIAISSKQISVRVNFSERGKLISWGSTNDEGQSYLTSGKHGETPEPFLLPTKASVVHAAAGWDPFDMGEVYTWGWKECVPSARVPLFLTTGGISQKDVIGKQSGSLTGQVNSGSLVSNVNGGTPTHSDNKRAGEEVVKRRKTSSPREESENSGCDDFFSLSPSPVTLNPGVNITMVAAGGQHTLVLSDTGALLTFGWGLYGQCGQGSTNDLLRPTSVSSLTGTQVERIAAGLSHTMCISVEGRVYVFGGNQFGQLGTGADQAETKPKLLDAPILENKRAKVVSCGARHSAMLAEDGQVLSWGWNKYGQLGLGDSTDRNVPSLVPVDRFLPQNVASGWWHTLLLGQTKL
ncbi:alsin-like [Mangifera indica]|uniref:alsin-like n=1 Tax=Mangifera indica TaxID=29780 RepID=UPI001CFA6BD1|nr:alsin-like [Mangifera indica]